MLGDAWAQEAVTRLALEALGDSDFALAGSGAIREHGITERPTADVDLFTPSVDTTQFADAVHKLVRVFTSAGYAVEVVRRAELFARLHVTTPQGRHVEIDLGVDSREDDAVVLNVGAVLSLEDAVGNKMSALYSRGEARDYLDVDSIRVAGVFEDAVLIELARVRDAGFELPMFVAQLRAVGRVQSAQVERYGVTARDFEHIRRRLTDWADRIEGRDAPPAAGVRLDRQTVHDGGPAAPGVAPGRPS